VLGGLVRPLQTAPSTPTTWSLSCAHSACEPSEAQRNERCRDSLPSIPSTRPPPGSASTPSPTTRCCARSSPMPRPGRLRNARRWVRWPATRTCRRPPAGQPAAPRTAHHDRHGNRLDQVDFHPAYHDCMRLAFGHGVHSLAWTTSEPVPTWRGPRLSTCGTRSRTAPPAPPGWPTPRCPAAPARRAGWLGGEVMAFGYDRARCR